MRFGVLGPLDVQDHGRPIPLGGRRHLEVLAMLLVDVGRPVSPDRIVTEVWGDDAGPRALASLYTHVSNLRRRLGRARIVHDAAGYRLVLDAGDAVDAARFEASTERARELSVHDPPAAVTCLESALALWRGAPFEGLEEIRALEPAIARLEQLRTDAELARFELLLRSGVTPSIGEVDDLCRRQPLDERPWGIMMRALYRSGRQVDALRTFRHVQELFGRELGVAPSPALVRIEEQILLHDPELDTTTRPPPCRLPTYLTSFVGRDDERAQLTAALRRHRLVTVTGPGGVGKTRLAVEAATRLTSEFPDGIWWVDLATVSNRRDVGPALAATVGAPGGADATAATAANALAGRRGLVILDNCEHVLDTVRETALALLARATDLTLLATSRVALEVQGEHRLVLAGLATVDDESPADARALFVDRALAIRPDLPGDADTIDAVGAVCRLLDGLPLALELAAARSDVLGPAEIAERLNGRGSDLVDPSRERPIHRSLEATIGWSYDLLDPERRADFDLLGVFEGPFTIDAAAAVLGRDESATIESVHGLVTASLVQQATGTDGPTQHRLLETLRLYARRHLAESGRWQEATDRHDRYYVAFARGLADQLLVRERPHALRRIADAEGELSSAWERLSEDDPAGALPLAWVLGNHWLVRGGIAEGEQRMTVLLACTSEVGGRWRMLALTVGSWVAARRNSRGRALAWSDEALELAETSGDPASLIMALNHAGQLRVDLGEHDAAIGLFDRSLDEIARVERAIGPHPDLADGRAWARLGRAEAGRWTQEPSSQVRDMLYDCHRHFVDVGEPEGRIRADRVLVTMPEVTADERRRLADEMAALAAASDRAQLSFEAARAAAVVNMQDGDHPRALAACRAAVRTAAASGALTEVASGFLHTAGCIVPGDPDRAAMLIGAGRRHLGGGRGPHVPVGLDTTIGEARRLLGEERFEELRHLGSVMALSEAVDLVVR